MVLLSYRGDRLCIVFDVLALVALHLETCKAMEQITDFRGRLDQVKSSARLRESVRQTFQFFILFFFRAFPVFKLFDLLFQVAIRAAQRNVMSFRSCIPLYAQLFNCCLKFLI